MEDGEGVVDDREDLADDAEDKYSQLKKHYFFI